MSLKTGCIIGNSHAAALIPLTRNADHPLRQNRKFCYFAAPAKHSRNIAIQNGNLVMTEEESAAILEGAGNSATLHRLFNQHFFGGLCDQECS